MDLFRDRIEMEIVDGTGIKETRTEPEIGTCTEPDGETEIENENEKEKATMQGEGIELSKIDRQNKVTTRLIRTERE